MPRSNEARPEFQLRETASFLLFAYRESSEFLDNCCSSFIYP